jgi:dihydrodipicolinate synthase/N-acetylneuraminate lyase
MIRAHASDDNGSLAVRMSIAQMDDDNEWRATHILRLGRRSWDHTYEAIEYPGTVQEPSLTFSHEEARALYEALDRHFGPRLPVIIHAGTELTETQAAELREQIRTAVAG